MLSFSYYLHERAEESRHNESIAFLIAILGAVFLIGGVLETVMTTNSPNWFLIFPYQLEFTPYNFLGLSVTLLGLSLFLAGVVLGIYYASQRSWYFGQLKEAYRVEEEKLRKRKGKSSVAKSNQFHLALYWMKTVWKFFALHLLHHQLLRKTLVLAF